MAQPWLARWFNRLLAPCLRRAILPTDSDEDRRYKTFLLALGLFVGLSGCYHLSAALVKNSIPVASHVLETIPIWTQIVFAIFTFAYFLTVRTVNKRLVEVTFYVCLVIIIGLADLSAIIAMLPRQWPSFVCVIDFILVLDMSKTLEYAMVGTVITWLVVTHVNDVRGWGVNLRVLLRGTDVDNALAGVPDACDCAEPPCGYSFNYSVASLLGALAVFLVDFFITRGFASQVRVEKQKIAASIDTAQKVTECLVKFDLDAARQILQSDAGMPDELYQSFAQLLANLDEYRPYLPDALMSVLHSDSLENNVAPRGDIAPGTVSGEACIVFTDIVGSTSLWANEPKGMARSLKIHNSVIRDAIRTHQGYEVKTIGDAFMVAFETIEDGVKFGLAVQQNLHNCAWPSSLLRYPQAARDEYGVWGGITVRIGVHAGELAVEMNPVTGRADYFGTTVNVAARTEAASAHGAVTLSQDVFLSLAEDMRQSVSTQSIGSVKLRGIEKLATLVALYPLELGRRQYGRLTHFETENHGGESVVRSGQSFGLAVSVRSVRTATVASVEIACEDEWSPDTDHLWKEHMRHLLAAAERCQGRVVGVIGRSTCVSWNVSRECVRHVENCMTLAGLLLRAALEGRHYALGCSSGSVAVGSIGRDGQSFVNVSGECVNLSRRLGEVARLKDQGCLYSNLLDESYVLMTMRPWLHEYADWSSLEGMHDSELSVYVYAPEEGSVNQARMHTMRGQPERL